MPTTPKDMNSLDYSNIDQIVDFVCDSLFLEKSQHRDFFFDLFERCANDAYDRGIEQMIPDRDQVERISMERIPMELEERVFCSLPDLK